MDIENLKSELNVLSNDVIVKTSGTDILNVSVKGVLNNDSVDETFNNIATTSIIPTYPNRLVFANEGGSIKAMYSK